MTTMDRLLGQVGIQVDTERARDEGPRARANRAAPPTGTTLVANLPRDAAARAAEVRRSSATLSSRPDDPAMRALVNHARGDRAIPRARSRRRRSEVAAATHRPSAEARVITPEGRAYCGEQVSLDLHTLAAGSDGGDLGAARRGGRPRPARRRRRVGRRPRGRVARVFEDRASAVYLPSGTAVVGHRADADGARARRDARRRHHRAARTSRPSSARPRSSCTTAANRAGNARCTTSSPTRCRPSACSSARRSRPAGSGRRSRRTSTTARDGEPALEEVYYFRCDRPGRLRAPGPVLRVG